jgi:hypothetical protein
MGRDALVEGYRSILRHIYAPRPYYARIKTFLREYKPPPVRDRFQFAHLMAVVRSVFRLGILGPERRHYWKLLLWTQFRRPRLIPEAITLSIYGYHFRKVCELHVFANP